MTAVKDQLPHGQFLLWIAAEFEMSERTARDFMQVHERFGGKSAIIADFKPTILYALSAPSTPESVIEKAIEQAESGEKVTVADCTSQPASEWGIGCGIAMRRRFPLGGTNIMVGRKMGPTKKPTPLLESTSAGPCVTGEMRVIAPPACR